MKRLYLLSIIALLLAGCAEEITNHNDSGRFLRFSVAEETNTTPSLTRGEGTDTPTSRIDSLESDYDEPLCMIVSTAPIGQEAATRGTEVATSSLNASGKSIQVSSTLFSGVANYNTTSNKFEPATATSWNGASSTSVTFSAWHPVNSALSAAGLSVSGTTFTYTLPTYSSTQTDLIGTTESHTYAEQNNGDVALTFKHLLAPVKFVLAANLKGQITSIKFSSIVKAGTHVLGTTNATTGQTWTSTSTGEYTATVSGTGSTSAVQVDGSEYFMMIPQTVAAGVVMTVTINDLAGTSNTLTYTVPSGGQVWKAGVVTTYTISTTAITSFTVTYPSWTDASTSDAVAGPVTTYTTSDYFGLFAVDKAGKIVIANAQVKVTTAGATATCNLADAANSGQFTNVIPSQNYTYYLMYPYVSDITTTYTAIALNASAPGGGSGTADTFFANVITGWTPAANQSTEASLKAQDLQVAKYNSGFAMAHQMGLAVVNLIQKTVITSRTVTYSSAYPNGNVSDGATKSVRASGDFHTNIMWNKDNANACYFVAKPGQVWTFDCCDEEVIDDDRTAENAWVSNFKFNPAANECRSYDATPRDIISYTAIFLHREAGYTFNVPMYACYKIEVWGASGGGNRPDEPSISGTSPGSCGGLGGYSYGHKSLKGTTTLKTLYVYVGGQGKSTKTVTGTGTGCGGGGWNGGGGGYGGLSSSNSSEGYGGGGMTHISTTQNPSSPVNSTWSTTGTLIVAGGGGGADDAEKDLTSIWKGSNDGTGGYGGGCVAGSGVRNSSYRPSDTPYPDMLGGNNNGATYEGVTYYGYAQGIGQDAWGSDTGGAGAGWWGGYSGNHSAGGGGGTSSLVDVGDPRTTIAGNPEAATATIPIAGDFTSASNVRGNWGNGFARITFAWVSRTELE